MDVVETLAADHIVDALHEAQIRLRLREVGPYTLAEAEKIAVRMEANITADKQRTRFVGKVLGQFGKYVAWSFFSVTD